MSECTAGIAGTGQEPGYILAKRSPWHPLISPFASFLTIVLFVIYQGLLDPELPILKQNGWAGRQNSQASICISHIVTRSSSPLPGSKFCGPEKYGLAALDHNVQFYVFLFYWNRISFGPWALVHVCQVDLTLCNDPVDCSPPGSSVVFSRQEYWSGLPCLPPGWALGPLLVHIQFSFVSAFRGRSCSAGVPCVSTEHLETIISHICVP